MKLTIGSPPERPSRESYGCKVSRTTPKERLINASRKRCSGVTSNQHVGCSLSIFVRLPFGEDASMRPRSSSIFFLNARKEYSSIITNGVYYIDSFLAELYPHRVKWTSFVIPMSKLKSQHRLICSLPSMPHLQGRILWRARRRTRTFGVLPSC